MSKAALIQAGVKTQTGLLIKKPCEPTQWISVEFYCSEHGTYSADYHFPTLGDAEKYAREQGAEWIFTRINDAQAWLSSTQSR